MNNPKRPSKSKSRRSALAPDQQQTAEYVAQISLGLMRMAAGADMPRLTSLLEKAFEEAVQQGGMLPRRSTKRR